MSQYDEAKKAVSFLKDDNTDGHKLYAIAECLLALTEQVKRVADYYDPEYKPLPCSLCGKDLLKEKSFMQAPGDEPRCVNNCKPLDDTGEIK